MTHLGEAEHARIAALTADEARKEINWLQDINKTFNHRIAIHEAEMRGLVAQIGLNLEAIDACRARLGEDNQP